LGVFPWVGYSGTAPAPAGGEYYGTEEQAGAGEWGPTRLLFKVGPRDIYIFRRLGPTTTTTTTTTTTNVVLRGVVVSSHTIGMVETAC